MVERLEKEFDAGETSQGLIVYQRDGGLTDADAQRIADDAATIEELPEDQIELIGAPRVPLQPNSPPQLVSENGEVAYTVLVVETDFDKIPDTGEDVREILDDDPVDGLTVKLSGDIGTFADFTEVFGELDFKLLLATVLLVLVLLGAIYRAVLVALTPILVVFFAYTVANGFIYLYAESGAIVSSNATGILIVLMFGVGTDYCLLLVSRYREELHRHEDKHEAMALALRQSGPAILASGLTVALAMLVLVIADSRNTNTLGPVAAIGVDRGDARGADAAAGPAHDLRPHRVLAAEGQASHTTRAAPPRAHAPVSGAGSATRSSSRRAPRSRSPSSPSGRPHWASSPTRSTTRAPASSRSRSTQSRASC